MKPGKANVSDIMYEGQIIFTPSRNPYAVLPGFVKAWAVTNLVFAGIWCLCFLCMVAVALLLWLKVPEYGRFLPVAGWVLFASAMGGGLGLYANIHLLSRKPHGVRGARLFIGFAIVRMLLDSFLVYCLAGQQSFLLAVSAAAVLLLGRIALLVFYWMAVSKAAKYFAERKRLLGF